MWFLRTPCLCIPQRPRNHFDGNNCEPHGAVSLYPDQDGPLIFLRRLQLSWSFLNLFKGHRVLSQSGSPSNETKLIRQAHQLPKGSYCGRSARCQ